MAEAAADEGQTPASMRIFVGGLGERVTEEELRSIFESRNLGRVEGVDIVRTKGRSFAYCNFLPSSTASISKIFSTYNGCAWKGGRLRLEKAKEHFLLRLRREWEEDAALDSPPNGAADAEKVTEPPEKPKKSISPDSKIKIFFPRLRKVKSLPLKGTGKHKYSFQRVEALPYPKHFCDCEEHSVLPSLPPVEQRTSKPDLLSGGVDAQEFDLMRSVMNKLFEKEVGLEIGKGQNKLAKEEAVEDTNSDESLDEDSAEEDMGEDDDDDDGIIINMVRSSGNIKTKTKKIENTIPILKRQKTGLAKDESGKNLLKVQKQDSLSIERSVMNGDGDERPSFTTQEEKKPKDRTELRAKWSQKSSWRELLGDKTKSSFSVSNLLSGANFTNEEEKERDDEDTDVPGLSDGEDQELDEDFDSQESEEDHGLENQSDASDSMDTDKPKNQTVKFPEPKVDVSDSSDGEDHEIDADSDSMNSEESEEYDGLDDQSGSSDSGDTEEPQNQTVESSEPKVDVPDSSDGKDDELDADSDSMDSEESEEDDGSDNQSGPSNSGDIEEPKTQTQEFSELKSGSVDVETKESNAASSNNMGRGAAWLHKSSWTQLVANSQNQSFSLSGISSADMNEKTLSHQDNIATAVSVTDKEQRQDEHPNDLVIGKEEAPSESFYVKEPKNPILHNPEGSNRGSSSRSLCIGEECLFMRSSASLRDWANSKAALTGSRKRKKA